jgi:glyoxalase family protein
MEGVSMTHVTGIHHITAIAGAPQENVDFYVGVLGLRLVKKSINQDAPDTYHLFFADGDGHPGTDLTFFPWPEMGPGRAGAGVWGEVSFAVPAGSLDYWESRLEAHGVSHGARETRFGETVLPFTDPHSMALTLTETETYGGQPFTAWADSNVPAEYQIRALASVRLTVRDSGATAQFLGRAYGFAGGAQDGEWTRYIVGEGAGGQRIDIRTRSDAPRGRWGAGSVHHVAFRVPDDEREATVRSQILAAGGAPTQVIDRFWFKSVYTQAPAGVICEIATDGPGFAVDEDPAHLGETLVLPPWYERQRATIEGLLPPLTLPAGEPQGDAVG